MTEPREVRQLRILERANTVLTIAVPSVLAMLALFHYARRDYRLALLCAVMTAANITITRALARRHERRRQAFEAEMRELERWMHEQT